MDASTSGPRAPRLVFGGTVASPATSPSTAQSPPTRPQHRRNAAERRRRRRQIRRNRTIALGSLVLVTVLSLTFGLSGGTPPSAAKAVPNVHLTSLVARTSVVPGQLGPIAWPTAGEGAIAVLGTGLMASSPAEKIVPIASLTKMMTALVFLHDHPLKLGTEGPEYTIGAAAVADYLHDDENDDSNVPVTLGEVLTEQQLLEALLIPSADNVADLLARIDAGSIPAFVRKMNAMVRTLGLHDTVYADASGVNPGSRSTAADQAVIASDLMENAAIRSIVRQPSLAFPVKGTIWNYNPALGVDGIVGVKSGFTSEAQGCLVTAAYRTAGGHTGLVISVSLGQPGGLYGAAQSDEALLQRAATSLRSWTPTYPVTSIATMSTGSQTTPLALGAPAPSVLAWPGLKLTTTVLPSAGATAGTPSAGSVVGNLVVSAPFGVVAEVPLVESTSTAPGPVNGVADQGGTAAADLSAGG